MKNRIIGLVQFNSIFLMKRTRIIIISMFILCIVAFLKRVRLFIFIRLKFIHQSSWETFWVPPCIGRHYWTILFCRRVIWIRMIVLSLKEGTDIWILSWVQTSRCGVRTFWGRITVYRVHLLIWLWIDQNYLTIENSDISCIIERKYLYKHNISTKIYNSDSSFNVLSDVYCIQIITIQPTYYVENYLNIVFTSLAYDID